MDGEAREISERLALVERSMRRYRAALAAVGLIAAAGFAGPSLVGAAKAPEVIQAKRFALVDDNGKVRASLDSIGDFPGLALYDKAGKLRTLLANGDDNSGLTFFDKAGRMREALGLAGNDTALALYDEAGKTRVFLDTKGDDTGLDLYDKAGKLRASLGTVGGDAELALHDEGGKLRAALGNDDFKNTATGSTEHRAASSLVLLNERGRVLWEAP